MHGAVLLAVTLAGSTLLLAGPALAQTDNESRGSDNIEVVAHIPLGPQVSDIEIEQGMDRPYAYVAPQNRGLDIIDLHDPYNPEVILRWSFEDQDRFRHAEGRRHGPGHDSDREHGQGSIRG